MLDSTISPFRIETCVKRNSKNSANSQRMCIGRRATYPVWFQEDCPTWFFAFTYLTIVVCCSRWTSSRSRSPTRERGPSSSLCRFASGDQVFVSSCHVFCPTTYEVVPPFHCSVSYLWQNCPQTPFFIMNYTNLSVFWITEQLVVPSSPEPPLVRNVPEFEVQHLLSHRYHNRRNLFLEFEVQHLLSRRYRTRRNYSSF